MSCKYIELYLFGDFYLDILVVPDKWPFLPEFPNLHNLQDHCISVYVFEIPFHKLQNILTNLSIAQVCLCNLADAGNLLPLPNVLSNLLDHCILCDVDVLLHHMLQNKVTMETIFQICLGTLVGFYNL